MATDCEGKCAACKSAGVNPGKPLRPLQLNPTNCERHHPNSAFENLKPDLIHMPLPDHINGRSSQTPIVCNTVS